MTTVQKSQHITVQKAENNTQTRIIAGADTPVDFRTQGPTAHTSNPTHSNATAPALSGPGEHSGSFSNVTHQADEPSNSDSSRYKPYRPSLLKKKCYHHQPRQKKHEETLTRLQTKYNPARKARRTCSFPSTERYSAGRKRSAT